MKKVLFLFFLLMGCINVVFASDTHDFVFKVETEDNMKEVPLKIELQLSVDFAYRNTVSEVVTEVVKSTGETDQVNFSWSGNFSKDYTVNPGESLVIRDLPTGVWVSIRNRTSIDNMSSISIVNCVTTSSNPDVDLDEYNTYYVVNRSQYSAYDSIRFAKVLKDEDDNLNVKFVEDFKLYPYKYDFFLTKELIGSDLKDRMFSFSLLDENNNVLATSLNTGDGRIVFSDLDIDITNNGDYLHYKIVENKSTNSPYIYDDSTIYVNAHVEYTKENGYNVDVNFISDKQDYSEYEYKHRGHPFHATEEELVGEAYAYFDKSTKQLVFFRDTPGKYTNRQTIGDRVYYSDLEKEIPPYYGCSDVWCDDENQEKIEEIIFEDAIRPRSISYWFYGLTNLKSVNIEKLDTSLIKRFDNLFYRASNLKMVDISTMDARNITHLSYSFLGSGIEYLDFTAWDLTEAQNRMVYVDSLLMYASNLKYLDISNFGTWDSSGEFLDTPCLEKLILGNKFNFTRGRIDGVNVDYWIKLEDNKPYKLKDLYHTFSGEGPDMTGTYIRAACRSDAVFKNKINLKYEENKGVIDEGEEKSNPETKDFILIMFIILMLTFITSMVYYKKLKLYRR